MTEDSDRTDPFETIRALRQKLDRQKVQTERWRAWALELESQMRREGWTQADFDSVWPDRVE
jgi:hypothetical protein